MRPKVLQDVEKELKYGIVRQVFSRPEQAKLLYLIVTPPIMRRIERIPLKDLLFQNSI